MTIYYDRGGVRITEQCIELGEQCFPHTELGRIEVAPPSGLAALFHIRRRWELWAEWHGAWILLYSCRSERVFGQVRRAVARARHSRRPVQHP